MHLGALPRAILLAILLFVADSLTSRAAITPDSPGGGSVQFTINSSQGVHAISQYIYGINSATGTSLDDPFTLDRLGGNRWTGYNWETNASNAGTDYLNESDNYLVNGANSTAPGQAVLPSLQAAATNNRALIVTVPMAGYVSADAAGPVTAAQAAPSSRWLQEVPKKSSVYSGAAAAFSLTPNKTDGYVFSDEFVNWVEQQKTASEKVFYMLDNEPGIWDGTHPYLHPGNPTWNELGNDTVATASAIKDVNPNALVFGGVGYGWNDFTSLQDAPDAVTDPAHLGGNHTGELNYYEYLLQKVHTAEVAQGRTLMDVLDLHWYPEATGNNVRITGNDSSALVAAARVQAPRSLFDPTYTETSWITQYSTLGPIKLLPRVQSDINAIKPGTKISISEYNFGGTNDISGGIAEADALGIFGDQNVFSAALWPLASDADSKFVEGAFKMYLNYNGTGGKFGDTSVTSTTSDLSQTSIHASVDSTNPNRMVVVAINRTGSAVTTGISVTNDRVFDHAEVYQLMTSSGSSTNYQIAHGANIDLNLLNAFLYTMPANSVSTLVLVSDGLPGDYNRDGKVDAADYVVWRNSIGTTGDVPADGNEDNVVDNKDFQLWRANFGRTEGSGSGVGSAGVPEPDAALLGLAVVFAASFFRRGRIYG
ncbi:MAG TPA: glycoside hydrolase family 44 protein [Lacipirellulaceae bacterium]|nr:glycoside hydrolase family 44 protein [Lacipirellulaceae bacterium]